LESGVTLGEWGDSWRVGGLLESGGTLVEWGYSWRVGGLSKGWKKKKLSEAFENDQIIIRHVFMHI
jgi:hypothetical protein